MTERRATPAADRILAAAAVFLCRCGVRRFRTLQNGIIAVAPRQHYDRNHASYQVTGLWYVNCIVFVSIRLSILNELSQGDTNMIKTLTLSMWKEDDGALSWEWTLITTIIVLGIVSGVAGARDAVVDEMGDISQGFLAVDQSYSIDFPLEITIDGDSTLGASNSDYIDSAIYADCARVTDPLGQGSEVDL